jgi:glycosyltransferase involved in cell wall biosynthesis
MLFSNGQPKETNYLCGRGNQPWFTSDMEGAMRIAVVHDYFTQMGGAEKVAEELVCMLPNPDLYSTVALLDRIPERLKGRHFHTSWMQHLPLMRKYHRAYFPLYPLGVRALDLSGYDLVVSSTSGYAKGVRTPADAVHVCYCHTPMRWAWEFDNYAAREASGGLMRMVLPLTLRALRRWDLKASRQPDYYVANSQSVAERIMRFYGREAHVIHPPIDVNRFHLSSEQDDYYLVLSRLVSYKRIDLAVEACTALKRRLIVIGEGPDRARLEAKAGPTVSFVGRRTDYEVEYYASRCRALIFPGEEDFGMAPLEVAAAGRPTIAYRGGGAKETIIEGETGAFFDQQQPGNLMKAIQEFEQKSWDSNRLRMHAQGFGIGAFQKAFRNYLTTIGCSLGDESVIPFPEHHAAPELKTAFGGRKDSVSAKVG